MARLAWIALAACTACGGRVAAPGEDTGGSPGHDGAAPIVDGGSPASLPDAGPPPADDASQPGPDATVPPDAADAHASPPPWAWRGPVDYPACNSGGDVFAAIGDGPLGTRPSIEESEGTWNGYVLSGDSLELDVALGSTPWRFTVNLSESHDPFLFPFSYTVDPGHELGLVMAGAPCLDPSGTFGLYALQTTGGDQAAITQLQASFEVTCATDAGAGGGPSFARGCVNYARPTYTPPPSPGPSDPMELEALCNAGPRDMFVVPGYAEVSNLDSIWSVRPEGPGYFDFGMTAGVEPFDFQVGTADGQPLSMAQYGPGATPPGPPNITLALRSEAICRGPATAFTLFELQSDADAGLGSLALAFRCGAYEGCLRYAE